MLEVDTEQVLVVPTALFHNLGHFQGFCGEVERYRPILLDPLHTVYRPRREMEQDPGFKQLIPYVIFRYAPAGQEPQVFQYTRGRGQGEGRLHSKRSVGVGGHISLEDTEKQRGIHPYEEGLQRELAEEVQIDTPFSDRCVGLINDDLTEVGRVHLGIVHLCDVERPSVHPREADILEAGFRPVSELLADLSGFETWSSICLEALFGER